MKKLVIGGLALTAIMAVGCAARARILAKRESEMLENQ